MVTNPSEPYRQHPSPFYLRMGRLMAGARTLRGITQSQAAEKLGVSQQTYAAWETGQRRMPIEQLDAVCTVIGCTPAYLLRHGVVPK